MERIGNQWQFFFPFEYLFSTESRNVSDVMRVWKNKKMSTQLVWMIFSVEEKYLVSVKDLNELWTLSPLAPVRCHARYRLALCASERKHKIKHLTIQIALYLKQLGAPNHDVSQTVPGAKRVGTRIELNVYARAHGKVRDEGVHEDVLAVEQLVHLGTNLGILHVGVVLEYDNTQCKSSARFDINFPLWDFSLIEEKNNPPEPCI
jgi:hypothetical protein